MFPLARACATIPAAITAQTSTGRCLRQNNGSASTRANAIASQRGPATCELIGLLVVNTPSQVPPAMNTTSTTSPIVVHLRSRIRPIAQKIQPLTGV